MESAEQFRQADEGRTHEARGEGIWNIGTTRNVRNQTFYRGDLRPPEEVFTNGNGIIAPRFSIGNGDLRPENPNMEEALTSTNANTPWVSLTDDLGKARRFLEIRMQERGVDVGYIYEITPETLLDTREVMMSHRDAREGRNANREVLVAGRVRPGEIHTIHKITRNPNASQSVAHQRGVVEHQIQEMRQLLGQDEEGGN
jgi:hypothetical protein